MNRIWKLDEQNLLITKLSGAVSLDTALEFRRIIVTLPGFTRTRIPDRPVRRPRGGHH
ncbi:MAG: hypothetical protein U5R48_09505 [Gammaproteobacteria bacterium]|nr:hypothetical protein [Gammaproteobacteria bacterium]